MAPPHHVVLEFSRADRADQPHAFEFRPQTYLLRGPGGAFGSAEFPWTPEFVVDIKAARHPAGAAEAIRRVGDTLRTFLAAAGWDHHEQSIVQAARGGASIIVTIRSAAAELYVVPWELLTLKSTGQRLGSIPGLLVRYEWPQVESFPDRVAPDARRRRVLLAWSAAAGAVPADRHLAALRSALGRAFDPARDVLAHASFAAIAEALAVAARSDTPIDALLVLCHGAAQGGTYGLVLEGGEPGGAVVLTADHMQQLIAPHAGMLRLVVLAACDSGDAGSPGDRIGGLAQMIHRAGLRAVVASRFPLSAAGSVRLTQTLFRGLADGASLEQAFVAARDALMRDPGELDWASVQLYSREVDGDSTFPLGPAPRPGSSLRRPGRRALGLLALLGASGLAYGLWQAAPLLGDAPAGGAAPECPPGTRPIVTAAGGKEALCLSAELPVGAPPCPDGMGGVPAGAFMAEGKKRVIEPFCLDYTEVTLAAYRECVAAKRCEPVPTTLHYHGLTTEHRALLSQACNGTRADREQHPINCASWYVAQAYCAWRGARLPSEWEWAWAARGGSEARNYPWGDSPPAPGRVNARGSECSAWGRERGQEWPPLYEEDDGYPTTAPASSHARGAGRWGHLNLAGNVAEWTASDHDVDQKSVRGGSWESPYADRLSTSKWLGFDPPAVRMMFYGFRCATDVSAQRTEPGSPVVGASAVSGWGEHAIGPFGGTELAPRAAQHDGKIWLVWNGSGDDGIWYANYDGDTWSPQSRVPAVLTGDVPSIASHGGALHLVWRGSGEDTRIWHATYDGASWSPQQPVPGANTSVGPAILGYRDRLWLTWWDHGNAKLWWSIWDGSWSGRQGVPMAATSSGPAMAVHDDRLFLAWRGVGDDTRIWMSSTDGNTWVDQTAVPGAATSHAPALTGFDGALRLAWKGRDDDAIWWSTATGSDGWSGPVRIDDVKTSSSPALTTYNSKMYLHWPGVKLQLLFHAAFPLTW